MRTLALPLASSGLLLAAWSCASPPPVKDTTSAPTASVLPTAAVPSKPAREVALSDVGLDASALDRKADPCTDFYRFACGGWIDKTEIPADKSRWVRSFNVIDERNEADLHRILDAAALEKSGSPERQKLGDYYAACLDEAAVEKAGTAAIKPLLDRAKKARSVPALLELVVDLHRTGIWPLFDASAEQDMKDATRYIAQFDQGGLGLPDRDYYTKDDDKSKDLRAAYVAHVAAMLKLAGYDDKAAARAATAILAFETEIAKISKTKVERRDPVGLYNKIDRSGVEKAVPKFPWARYFKALGIAGNDVNVTSAKFFEGLSGVLAAVKVDDLRDYLAWHIVHSTASTLPKAFVDEAFHMEQALTGVKEQRLRWKRCVDATDEGLGEVLAQDFVSQRFSADAKSTAQMLVKEIGAAFLREVETLPWMDAATKEAAKKKFATMAYLIGYPDKWKAYDFAVSRASFGGNVLAARAFDVQRRLARIGKPIDRGEWLMTPPTVNAYYDPQKNQMVFPAGILQPPFYSPTAGVAVNLGAMGMVVGHELTHGFDDEGSQYDQDGNLRDWWSADVKTRFKAQTGCVASQYGTFEPLPGLKVNGQLTLGENIADMGGIKLAFQAYRTLRASAPEAIVAEGFSEDQQFFLATGQIWCAKYRDEYARMAVQVDPHSPPRFRVNGPMSNLSEFGAAWSCPSGVAMRPKDTCSVW